jgi:hypothetical protein
MIFSFIINYAYWSFFIGFISGIFASLGCTEVRNLKGLSYFIKRYISLPLAFGCVGPFFPFMCMWYTHNPLVSKYLKEQDVRDIIDKYQLSLYKRLENRLIRQVCEGEVNIDKLKNDEINESVDTLKKL